MGAWTFLLHPANPKALLRSHPEYLGGSSVQQCTDGGYIVTGFTRYFGCSNGVVYLIKTDSNGDTLWTKTYAAVELQRVEAIIANPVNAKLDLNCEMPSIESCC